jgi:hypothetical protein
VSMLPDNPDMREFTYTLAVPSMVRFMPIWYATGRYMHVQEVLTGTYRYMMLQETTGVAHDLAPGYARKAKQWLVHGGGVP